MSRVNMSLDIDMSNEGQLTAVSNFFKDLAKAAPATRQAELDRLDKELAVQGRWSGKPVDTQSIAKMEVVDPEDVPGKPLASQTTKEEEDAPSGEKSTVASTPKKRSSVKSSTTRKKSTAGSSEDAEPESSTKSKGIDGKTGTTSERTPKEETSQKQESDKPSPKPSTEAPQDLREPLRVLLAEKVDDHRATIKAELGKYDAKGISNLAVEHHAAFMDFMQNLK